MDATITEVEALIAREGRAGFGQAAALRCPYLTDAARLSQRWHFNRQAVAQRRRHIPTQPGREQIQTALHILQTVMQQVKIKLEFGQRFGFEIGMTFQ